MAFILTIKQDRAELIEIGIGGQVNALAFSADGERLMSGSLGAQVWRVRDRDQVGTMKTSWVVCLAVSRDGKWIAATSNQAEVLLWNAQTYARVWAQNVGCVAVDFSPDCTRLVSANYASVVVWDLATRKQIQTLHHGSRFVVGTKYSPQGDRIAIATHDSIQLWHNNGRRLPVDIKVEVFSSFNRGFVWFSDHIFVLTRGTVKKFDASTGSALSEWSVPDTDNQSCIALPRHGRFIVCSAKRAVTFWDTSTRTQFAVIEHPQDVRSITLSPDDRFLAIGGRYGKIMIHTLSHLTVSIVPRWT